MVRSDPPGALVSVDNQVIGHTPAATPFVYYGTREIRVEHDGFETQTLRHKINPPWYQIPGIDFLAETFWPFELRDERIVDTKLQPQIIEPAETIADRADQLRQQANSGVTTTLPPTALSRSVPVVETPPQSQVQTQSIPIGGIPAQVAQ